MLFLIFPSKDEIIKMTLNSKLNDNEDDFQNSFIFSLVIQKQN